MTYWTHQNLRCRINTSYLRQNNRTFSNTHSDDTWQMRSCFSIVSSQTIKKHLLWQYKLNYDGKYIYGAKYLYLNLILDLTKLKDWQMKISISISVVSQSKTNSCNQFETRYISDEGQHCLSSLNWLNSLYDLCTRLVFTRWHHRGISTICKFSFRALGEE